MTGGSAEPADLFEHLEGIARGVLPRYGIPADSTIRLLNLSENATYRVDWEGGSSVLRLNRIGYHTKAAIESELAWMTALRVGSVVTTPAVIPSSGGERVELAGDPSGGPPRHCVMMTLLEGVEPPETELVQWFEPLGEITARLHEHARAWQVPRGFVRHTWDIDSMFGQRLLWGRWQDGLGVEGERHDLLASLEAVLRRRMLAYGRSHERFGLIHADLRIANLLVEGAEIKVIDFDDMGFSWYLYDLASALTFIEHRPEVPELVERWVRGYRRQAQLSLEEEAEIDTFIMMRRLLIVAWVGSHQESPVAQEQGLDYTEVSCVMAERYLSRFG